MKINILKWDEINSKSDAMRTPNWFRVNQEIGISQSLFDLNSGEKWVWVLLLATRCKAKKSEFEVNAGWFCSTFNVQRVEFDGAIKKLSDSSVIAVTDSPLTVHRQSLDLHNITEHTEQNITVNAAPAVRAAPEGYLKSLSKKIWESYATAYFDRYGTEPVRNAKVNAQVGQLAKRLGEEAPDVVRFYVGHSKSFYVQKAHEIGLCLADAEGLRTQWATGNKITNVQARQADSSAAINDQIQRIREGKL